MPNTQRPGRLGRQDLFNSGGGGFNLAGLLMSSLGGIEADPMFAPEGEIGNMPFDKPYQSDSPYKGKTIFDKNEASRANADYKIGQFEANSGLKRALMQKEGELGLTNKYAVQQRQMLRPENRADAEVEDEFAQRKAERDQQYKLAGEEASATIEYMKQERIPPTKENFILANQKLTQLRVQELAEKSRAGAQEARASSAENLTKENLANATRPSTLASAISQGGFNQQISGFRNQDARKIYNDSRTSDLLGNAKTMAEINATNVVPVPDTGLFNLGTGGYSLFPKQQDLTNPLAPQNPMSRIPPRPTAPAGTEYEYFRDEDGSLVGRRPKAAQPGNPSGVNQSVPAQPQQQTLQPQQSQQQPQQQYTFDKLTDLAKRILSGGYKLY